MDWKALFTSFEGRIDRRLWWIGMVVLFLASLVAGILFGDGGLVLGIVNLLVLLAGIALHVKRLHDRGKSGLWVLVFFIPLIGTIWMIVEMGFLGGDEGANRYGPPPSRDSLASGMVAGDRRLEERGERRRGGSPVASGDYDGGPSGA